ncbi:MAG: Maf family protein [bacterium]
MNKIILASLSPRRKDLLTREGIDFIVDASNVPEILDPSLTLHDQLVKIAYDKGLPIHQKYPDDIVISADTTVCLDDEIIGKPADAKEAREILLKLSSRTHMVYTSVCIFYHDQLISWVEETQIIFKDIRNLLDDYIASLEWQGKAGAYGIQGLASAFVEEIHGDYDSVVGLPVKRVVKEIQSLL